MKQQKVIIISAFLIILVPMIMGSFYGLEFGYLALFCTALAGIFFNLHSFSSFEVFKIKAKLNETSDKTDKLNEFSILYVQNELASIETRADSASVRQVAQMESFHIGPNKPPYHFKLTYANSCIDLLRVKNIVKILDIRDKETLSLLNKLEIKNALELQDSFELTIQSYMAPNEKEPFEHSEALQKFSEDRELSTIFDSFKVSGTFNFERLEKLKKQLEHLPGDKEYLSKNWQSLVRVLNMLLAPLEEVTL